MKQTKFNLLILAIIIISSLNFSLSLTYNENAISNTKKEDYLLKEDLDFKLSPAALPDQNWSVEGIEICTASNYQLEQQIISDGVGGAFITWTDLRDAGVRDIYAQRIDSSGAVMWDVNGIAVCNATGDQSSPYITSDGVGGVIICWVDARNGMPDLYAQRITPDGITLWADNGTVVCNASMQQFSPLMISDGAGGAIISWQDYRCGGGITDVYSQKIDSDGNSLWPANGTMVCNATNNQININLVSDGAGGAIITWEDYRDGGPEWDIYAQKIDINGNIQWIPNGTGISNLTEKVNWCYPLIVSDGAGGAIITWYDNRSSTTTGIDIYAQRIDTSGNNLWTSHGKPIIKWTADQEDLDIITDNNGGAILSWCDNRYGDQDIFVQRINSNGDSLWIGNGTAICNATNDQDQAQIVSDGSGGAIIAWEDARTTSETFLYAQRVDPEGTTLWDANGTAICTVPDSNVKTIRIAGDSEGGAIMAWIDGRNSGSSDDDIYAQRYSTNNKKISTETDDQRYPEITTDGVGGAIIVWQDERTGGSSETDIYAQRIAANGTTMWDDNGTVICNHLNIQQYPKIISDGTGGAIITWADRRNLVDYNIYAQRIDSNGNTLWADNGTVICNATDKQDQPQLTSDGASGAIIVWVHGTSNPDLYAQRIDSNGNTLWTDNGTVVSNAGNWQRNPRLISDGASGAIITWEDSRNTAVSDFDIYAQRMDSNGNPLWMANGTIICNELDTTNKPKIISDLMGGAIIVWQDERDYATTDVDIYAQRIDPNGNTLWTDNGSEIVVAPSYQNSPELVSDGEGGAIITWVDDRAAQTDIYAQKVDSTGATKWTTNGEVVCSAVGSQSAPQIAESGYGMAIIIWVDNRRGNSDIFAQRVNASGEMLWDANGSIISMEINTQSMLTLVSNDKDGAVITWYDYRNGQNYDIYARIISTIEDLRPYSNAPADITTSKSGTHRIGWILRDDFGADEYRVRSNNTAGTEYTWIDWTSWTSGVSLDVALNKSDPGWYYYRIEYRDDQNQYGIPNTVTIHITDANPTSNNPDSVGVTVGEEGEIKWILRDDFGGGKYRVLKNNTDGEFVSVIKDWTSWTSGKVITIKIEGKEKDADKTFVYVIEYYDNYDNHGVSDEVQVDIYPASTVPADYTMIIIIAIIGGVVGLAAVLVITKRGGGKERRLITDYGDAAGKTLIFVSYATVDSKMYRIKEIAKVLSSYPEIDEVLYWEEDMRDDIFAYMDENLKRCKLVLLFCSPQSNASDPVKMEWRSALKMERKVVPIFKDPNDIPALLTTKLGIQFDQYDFYGTVENMYQMILKKLEIAPTRNIFDYITSRQIPADKFKQDVALLKEQKNIIEVNLSSSEALSLTKTHLEDNNFYVFQEGTSLYGFAEYKFEKIKLACSADMIESEGKTSIVVKTMSDKEWLLTEASNSFMRWDPTVQSTGNIQK